MFHAASPIGTSLKKKLKGHRQATEYILSFSEGYARPFLYISSAYIMKPPWIYATETGPTQQTVEAKVEAMVFLGLVRPQPEKPLAFRVPRMYGEREHLVPLPLKDCCRMTHWHRDVLKAEMILLARCS